MTDSIYKVLRRHVARSLASGASVKDSINRLIKDDYLSGLTRVPRGPVLGSRGQAMVDGAADPDLIPTPPGLVYYPLSDSAPYGWGEPYENPPGTPVNPPLGTVLANSFPNNADKPWRVADYDNGSSWTITHGVEHLFGPYYWSSADGNQTVSWGDQENMPGTDEERRRAVYYAGKKLCSGPDWETTVAVFGRPIIGGEFCYALKRDGSTRYLYAFGRLSSAWVVGRTVVDLDLEDQPVTWSWSSAGDIAPVVDGDMQFPCFNRRVSEIAVGDGKSEVVLNVNAWPSVTPAVTVDAEGDATETWTEGPSGSDFEYTYEINMVGRTEYNADDRRCRVRLNFTIECRNLYEFITDGESVEVFVVCCNINNYWDYPIPTNSRSVWLEHEERLQEVHRARLKIYVEVDDVEGPVAYDGDYYRYDNEDYRGYRVDNPPFPDGPATCDGDDDDPPPGYRSVDISARKESVSDHGNNYGQEKWFKGVVAIDPYLTHPAAGMVVYQVATTETKDYKETYTHGLVAVVSTSLCEGSWTLDYETTVETDEDEVFERAKTYCVRGAAVELTGEHTETDGAMFTTMVVEPPLETYGPSGVTELLMQSYKNTCLADNLSIPASPVYGSAVRMDTADATFIAMSGSNAAWNWWHFDGGDLATMTEMEGADQRFSDTGSSAVVFTAGLV